MKIFVVTMLILSSVFAFGQTQVTRYTPKGSPVRAYNNIPEMSSTDKTDWSASVLIYYPNATEINTPSATKSYNCHAYAWHVKEGGDAVWIGYYQGQEADEDIYWIDGSYNNQSSEVGAEKISYYNGNHSAVQTTTQGVYVSKWGEGPLMQHSRDYGPSIYNMAYRNYYKKALQPTLSGPSEICYNQSGTYTINNLPADATVSWYANGLTPSTGTGASFTALPVSGTGAGYVRATVTTLQSSFTLQKDLSLNGYVPIDGPDVEYLSHEKAYFSIDDSFTSVQWKVNGVTVLPISSNRIVVVLNNYYPGDILITCRVVTSCGTFEARKDLHVIDDTHGTSQ